MEIFVQSRGSSPDFEYCWQPKVPDELSDISSLIQSESPSVVLARLKKKLILLTTGLESPEKKDFRDRPIRHSVCWICNDNDYDERKIRAIAVQALGGLLSDQVDEYIKLGGENGFEISSGLENLAESLLNKIKIQDLQELEKSPKIAKIAKNSKRLRDDIARELQQYRLPEDYKFIVIATGIKSEDALEKVGAWRSLSSLVKLEDWRDLKSQNFMRATIAIPVAVIVVALILLVVLLHPFNPEPKVPPSPIPTTSPTQQSPTHSPEAFKNALTPSVNSKIESVPL